MIYKKSSFDMLYCLYEILLVITNRLCIKVFISY